jgi:hypothetical protein
MTLLLVAVIGALFYEPTGGTQDNHKQPSTVAPDNAQQFVTYTSCNLYFAGRPSPSSFSSYPRKNLPA